jgi:hypothetical protein
MHACYDNLKYNYWRKKTMGNLVVKRTSSAMGALIGWDVLVDGVNVGKLKNGKSIECDVAPGTHVAYVSTSQWFSNEVPFVIDGARPNAVIECALGKPGKQFATAMAFGARTRLQQRSSNRTCSD